MPQYIDLVAQSLFKRVNPRVFVSIYRPSEFFDQIGISIALAPIRHQLLVTDLLKYEHYPTLGPQFYCSVDGVIHYNHALDLIGQCGFIFSDVSYGTKHKILLQPWIGFTTSCALNHSTDLVFSIRKAMNQPYGESYSLSFGIRRHVSKALNKEYIY